jgi:hypothetical protein
MLEENRVVNIYNKELLLLEYTHERALFLPPSQRQNQNYFTTGDLPPLSLSWRQAPRDSRPEIYFPQLNPCGISPYVTSSLTKRWVCLL